MKTCSKCRKRLSDVKFRTRNVTTTTPDIEGRMVTESHITSGGSVCKGCSLRSKRAFRGTQTVHDVAQDILVDLRGRRR